MSKKVLSLCLAIMAMLCLPTMAQANVSVEFKFMHQNESVTELTSDTRVYIYYSGANIASGRSVSKYDYQTGKDIYTGNALVSLNDDSYVGKTLAYISSMGHRGEFVLDESDNVIELQCTKLTITAKDDEGNPMNGNSISLKGQASFSKTTNAEGLATLYVAPGDYDWSWNYGSGSIDLTTDQTLELTAQVEKIEEVKTYRINFVPRYGNFPAFSSNSSSIQFYLYQDGIKKKSTYYHPGDNYNSGFSATAGTYQIRDEWGGSSGDIEIKSDTTIYLDYHKVTFTSKSGSTPNAGQIISVCLKDKDNNFYKTDATTNAKGVAELYFLSGEYTCTAAGGTKDFIVGNTDTSVNIETVMVTFNIHCDNLNALTFYVNEREVFPTDDGTLAYGCLPGGEVVLIVRNNRYDYTPGSIVVTADASKTVDVDVYSLTFKTNNSNVSGPILSNDGYSYSSYSFSWNKKYYLLAGTYRYRVGGQEETVTLDKNTVIEKNFATLTVNVKDTDGKAAENLYVSVNGSYSYTDDSGKVILYLLPGEYTLNVDSYERRNITVTGDATETFIIPGFITFTVIAESNYSYFDLYEANSSSNRISCQKDGDQVTARIDPSKEYRFGGCQGKTTITEGCTITLGTLSVTSQGNGLAFPMENWDAVSTYNVIVGSPVRLSAIPVGNDKFQKWTVNGKDYTDAMIDFKTTVQHTTAMAVFSNSASSVLSPMQSNSSLIFNDSYITLPADMEGTARIFTLDGKQVKQIGVVGDQIGIYDLPTGAYVLSFQHDDGVINARFLKK